MLILGTMSHCSEMRTLFQALRGVIPSAGATGLTPRSITEDE